MKNVLIRLIAICAAVLSMASAPALADSPRVIDAKGILVDTRDGVEIWTFEVTIAHADTGWDHYANAFEILAVDGSVLGLRTLYHPHEDEQPFTRSLTKVKIPAGTQKVIIRAHDTVHGYSKSHLELKLTRPKK
ncbi:MAG: hypothetical protein MRY74_12695 [Neomegalonema sp.]|nr:hypothetical protein [Neomegalonema sp.]